MAMGNDRTKKIIRRAIFTFLKNYHHFTSSLSILLLLPFSVSSLLFRASLVSSRGPPVLPSPVFPLVCWLFASVFFLVKAKSFILQVLDPHNKLLSSHSLLCKPLILIQSFHLLLLGLSSGLIELLVTVSSNDLVMVFLWTIYYVICTNTTVVFNLAFVISNTRNLLSPYASIREALSLRVRDSSTTLLLALASSTGYAAIEALFRCRMSRALSHWDSWRPLPSLCLEGLTIAYLYSIIVMLDTIACFLLVDGYGSEPKPKPNSNALQCRNETEESGNFVQGTYSCEEILIDLCVCSYKEKKTPEA